MRSNQDYSYYFDGRLVQCLLCNNMATVKPTKTGKLMLRCDNCMGQGEVKHAAGLLVSLDETKEDA